MFSPHAHTVPSDFSASECAELRRPLEIAVMLVSPLTVTGVDRSVVVPSPNRPELLLPHAHTVPSDFSASE